MLNISHKRINDQIRIQKYKSFQILEKKSVSYLLIRIMMVIVIIGFLSMFLPWTQNIRSKGYVTTLNPQDRPQSVEALIGGRIEEWYVQEGQIVTIGDTIMRISEGKEEYFDPDILDRTQDQILAKKSSSKAYDAKANSLVNQLGALVENKKVKLEQNEIKIAQVRLKIKSDSLDLIAAETQYQIAENQLDRMETLFEEGLKPLTDLESKRLSIQKSNAKVISLENKLLAHQNELINLKTNRRSIESEYNDKIAKSQADRMSAMSAKYDAEANQNKLQSQFNAYQVRQDNYFITSPINGIITQAIQNGIGEVIKNGDELVTIMPTNYELAVEMYVRPRDMPLLKKGQKVRVQFDGWPAIVFSGWPGQSYGTFGGRVFAIDNFIGSNGKYRILIAPDNVDGPWPREVRVGGGANTITLLNRVSVGYEIWRQLNGFPADYYDKKKLEEVKTKAPLRKVK